MLNELLVGPKQASDNTPVGARGGRAGETIVGDVHGHFYEAVYRNNVYVASTAVAGVSAMIALSNYTSFCLYNPLLSGKNMVVLATTFGFVSGTLTYGYLAYAGNAVTTAPTGTAITPRNCFIGGPTSSMTALALATVTTPTLLRPVLSFGAFAQATAAIYQTKDLVDGEFIIPPGSQFCFQMVAPTATQLGVYSATWEEVPA